ncbi:hypothetical protein KC357_g69 [Hortaea werneckii]|nr:hypothetical protein KC357_g69 [Hortaea werneckii]
MAQMLLTAKARMPRTRKAHASPMDWIMAPGAAGGEPLGYDAYAADEEEAHPDTETDSLAQEELPDFVREGGTD